MIISFQHKGLERFYNTGDTRGIQAKHKARLTLLLTLLDSAKSANDMGLAGAKLHPLKGQLKAYWSVKVSGHWRLIFKFENGNAQLVDYLDYH